MESLTNLQRLIVLAFVIVLAVWLCSSFGSSIKRSFEKSAKQIRGVEVEQAVVVRRRK